jgi:hypothetical protein
MGYINPTWLDTDKHGKALSSIYSEVEPIVDAEIYRACYDRGITIPVDGTGYIDSQYLQTIAINLALWKLLGSASGIRDNDNDEYERKSLAYQQEYYNGLSNLCYSKV